MRRVTTILPAMRLAEALETTRPCRAPHQTMAEVERIGGERVGTMPIPERSLEAEDGRRAPRSPAQAPRRR